MRIRNVLTGALALLTVAAGFAPQSALAQADPPKPRILVLTFDRGDPNPRDMVQGIGEETLISQGFPLVDSGQLHARHQLEDLERFVLLTPERERIAELKTRFGVDYIVAIRYTRTFHHARKLMGVDHKFYKSTVNVKAIAADTAGLVHSSGGETQIQARTDELEQLAREHVGRAGQKIMAQWQGAQQGKPRGIEVVAKGFDHDDLSRLEAGLKTVPGVLGVTRRDFAGPAQGAGNALIEVTTDAKTEVIARYLSTLQNPAVEVVSSTGSRIEIKPAKKLRVGFASPKEGQLITSPSIEAVVNVSGPVTGVTIGGVQASATGTGRWSARITLNPGQTSLVAAARDDLGRQAQASVSFRSDTTPPTLTIVEPTRHLTNQPSVTVVASAQDAEGAVRVSANGSELFPDKRPGHFSGQVTLRDGQNIIVVTATDQAGLTTERRVQVMLDRTPPVLTGQVVAIIEGSTEPGSTVSYGGKPINVDSDGNFRLTVQAPPGGTITIIATDAAGNRSEQVYRIGGSAELTPSTEEIR